MLRFTYNLYSIYRIVNGNLEIEMMKNVNKTSGQQLAEYHVIAKRWKSDLEFFKIESAFLIRLKRDYYFTRLSDYRNTEELQKAGDQLIKLQHDILLAESQVDAQLHELAEAERKPLDENTRKLALTNASVGHLMINLTHEYQQVKKQLFTIVETIFLELEILAH